MRERSFINGMVRRAMSPKPIMSSRFMRGLCVKIADFIRPDRPMSFKTTIKPSNHSFAIGKDETILEAALEHGYTLPYSCRNGACGVCKGKVLQGTVDHGKAQDFALSEAEKA